MERIDRMGFVESLSTLSMDQQTRSQYYALANSNNPEDRARAKQMLNGGGVTPSDLAKTYAQGFIEGKLKIEKEQYADMKQMVQNYERENHTYHNIDTSIQNKIKMAYSSDDNKKEKSVSELLSEINNKLSDVLPENDDIYNSVEGPELG